MSRRGAEELITTGRVSVNGKVIKDLSTQIQPTDKVQIDNKLISLAQDKVYIIMNKPKGYITSCRDEMGRKTVLHLLGKIPERVFPIGRLDCDTEGLLILTNDGDFANSIMHPSQKIEKVYVANVDSPITDDHIRELKTQADRVTRLDQRTIEIVIHEGKNRQVRKMVASVGLEVVGLRRESIGRLVLKSPDAHTKPLLKNGEYFLTAGEFVCLNTPPII